MKKCNIIDDISIKMMSTDFNRNPDYNDNRKSKFENFDCKSLIC